MLSYLLHLSSLYLLLSYDTMSTSCLISPVVYLPAYTCLCLRHGFQCMIMILFYRYTCAYPCSPFGFCLTTRLGSSDSSGSSCPGFGAWNMWILPVADQSGTAVAWISTRPFRALSFQASCVPLEFSFCKLVSVLFTVHSCTSLVFSQLRISVM